MREEGEVISSENCGNVTHKTKIKILPKNKKKKIV